MTFAKLLNAACLCAALGAVPAAATAGNLLANGNFDTNLAGWQFPDATPAWQSFDAGGAATSGSALSTNDAAAANARFYVLQQCVVVTEPGLYVFGASAYTPSGQVDGSLLATYMVIPNATCSGDSLIAEGGFFMPSIDHWQAYTSNSFFTIPSPLPPQLSVRLMLGLDKTPAGGTFRGYFDRVFFVHDGLFSDGFGG